MKFDKDSLNDNYTEEDFCFFWGHTPSKDGSITETCLSQWWLCSFMENQIIFCCAEQYMMYKKALLFDDYEYAQKIISCKNPKKIKEYGRLVKNFDENKWDEEKYNIVLKGNILKFSQNGELYHYLVGTNSKILVEASPYDRVWGIGMRKNAEGVLVPDNWKGQNMLGFALMDTRERLRG